MGAFGQTNRLMSFTSPLGADVLLPERLTGFEGVSELFCYKLDLLADVNTAVNPTQIVGKRVCVSILTDDSGTQRFINGIVSSFEMMTGDQELNRYLATIVPSLWTLTLNKNTRVFQNKTVIDVIQQVLSPYSISPSVQTSNTYEPLDYCTQYRETDFHFIARLMEQHGIFYYFQHTADDHTMVLQDTSNKLSDCPIQATFQFRPERGHMEASFDFVVNDLSARSTLVPGKHTAWDYSFVRYQSMTEEAMTAGPLGANSNELYDYADATGYLKASANDSNLGAQTTAVATVRRDASDAETQMIEGGSNAIAMQTGYTFSITGHPQPSVNTKYVLLRTELTLQQVPSYRSDVADNEEPFQNVFRAIPFSIVYRPPIVTEKPVVYGMHTGQVVVSSGEESHMDKYGRCNVQFWWDRLRKPNTPDGTWLRVAQSWAANGWGTYYWPRKDDEVLIGFMEGDPDQPIVVGSVYNGVNMPPYDPVGQYTLSGIKTRSSKGGGASNANELRFEDLSGKEQIFMNAEKDFLLHVEHDWQTQVDNEQHITVKSNRFDEVDGDQHVTVKGNHTGQVSGDENTTVSGKNVVSIGGDRENSIGGNLKEQIGANSNISVASNLNEQVGQNYSLTVGMNQAISAGMNFDVSAPMQISFSCGSNSIFLSPEGIGLNGMGGFISITPAGVTISGMLVMINSGGAPVQGSPGNAQSPQSPSSPKTPTAPKYAGDGPTSTAKSDSGGSAGAAANVTDAADTFDWQEAKGVGGIKPKAPPAAAAPPPPPPPPAIPQSYSQYGAPAPPAPALPAIPQSYSQYGQAAQGAAQQAEQQAQAYVNLADKEAENAAQQAAQAAQQAAQQAQQAAQQAQQQAQQAVNQAVQQARQEYQQAQQAVAQAEQQVQQAGAAASQQAKQALAQAQQQAQQCAQQASQAVQQAQQQAQQVEQQAQQAAQQAQQQAQQAAQQAQQAANQAKQGATQAAQQAQQAAQQAEQQAQQASQAAQQSAQQAMNSIPKGF